MSCSACLPSAPALLWRRGLEKVSHLALQGVVWVATVVSDLEGVQLLSLFLCNVFRTFSHCGWCHLSTEAISLLDRAQSFDFYGFLRLPKRFFAAPQTEREEPRGLLAAIEASSVTIDLLALPCFLQDWGLIDLAPVVRAIGRFPIFSWVVYFSLDQAVRAIMCLNFVLKAVHGVVLFVRHDDRVAVALYLMFSLGELAYNAAILCSCPAQVIGVLAALAKGFGLLSLTRPCG